MSHHHQIILQSLQHLSESTHGSSHQIRPVNSVTPPPLPAPAGLPAPLRRSSVPPLTLFSLLPSPAISRSPFPPSRSPPSLCSAHLFSILVDSFGFGSPLLLNAVHAPTQRHILRSLHSLLTTVVEVHVPKPYLGGSIVAVELLRVKAGLASLQPQLDPADVAAALEHHAVQTPATHGKQLVRTLVQLAGVMVPQQQVGQRYLFLMWAVSAAGQVNHMVRILTVAILHLTLTELCLV